MMKYQKYDNYNAININRIKDIPRDYYGVMGVPITFLNIHNPEQFDILDRLCSPYVNSKRIYKRVLIKRIK